MTYKLSKKGFCALALMCMLIFAGLALPINNSQAETTSPEWNKSGEEYPHGTYKMKVTPAADASNKVRVEVELTILKSGTLNKANIIWRPEKSNGYTVVKETVEMKLGKQTFVTKGSGTLCDLKLTGDLETLGNGKIDQINEETKNPAGIACIPNQNFAADGYAVDYGSVLRITADFVRNSSAEAPQTGEQAYPLGPGRIINNFTPKYDENDSEYIFKSFLNNNAACKLISPLGPADQQGEFPRNTTHTGKERMASRDLSSAEKERGTSVFVTASTPGGLQRRSSQLYLQEAFEKDFKAFGKKSGWVLNSLAYNPKDNYLYALSQGRDGINEKTGKISTTFANTGTQMILYEDGCYPAGHLLQIHPETGEIRDLGQVKAEAGSTVTDEIATVNRTGLLKSKWYTFGFQGKYGNEYPNDLWGGINVGFFDDNGAYWVANASTSGTGALYKVNIDTVEARSDYFSAQKPSRFEWRPNCGDWCAWSEDYTVLHDDGGNYAYGLVNRWVNTLRGSGVLLERIDLDTGKRKLFDLSKLTAPNGRKITQQMWSKAWEYGNGVLGFGTGSNGANSDVVAIKLKNPKNLEDPGFELISVSSLAPSSYNTNGTSNGYANNFSSDVEISKTFDKVENGRVYYTLKVWNNGPDGASKVMVTDQLDKAKFTNFKIESINAPNEIKYESTPEVGVDTALTERDTAVAEFGLLKARNQDGQPTIEIRISAELKPGELEQCVVNTASVFGYEADANIQNNTSTESCDLKINKTVVGEVSEPDADGNYSVTYDVVVSNSGNEAIPYSEVVDIPKFSDAFTPVIFEKAQLVNGNVQGEYEKVEANGEGGYTLAPAGKLDPKGLLAFRVKIGFQADEAKLNGTPDLRSCKSDGGGLLNTAHVSGNKALACTDFPDPKNITLKISKVSAEDQNLPLSGAQFAIYPVNGDGTPNYDAQAIIPTADAQNEVFSSAIDPGTYYLVETKAPASYSLLLHPVKFSVAVKQNKAQITLDDTGGGLITAQTDAADNMSVRLKVADVKTGTLPHAGGIGVFPFILLFAGCVLLALLVQRKSSIS